jgi:hypothetical protein
MHPTTLAQLQNLARSSEHWVENDKASKHGQYKAAIVREENIQVSDSIKRRVRHNEEINTLLKGEDTVRFIKSQRIR